jgi:hypothetical protein
LLKQGISCSAIYEARRRSRGHQRGHGVGVGLSRPADAGLHTTVRQGKGGCWKSEAAIPRPLPPGRELRAEEWHCLIAPGGQGHVDRWTARVSTSGQAGATWTTVMWPVHPRLYIRTSAPGQVIGRVAPTPSPWPWTAISSVEPIPWRPPPFSWTSGETNPSTQVHPPHSPSQIYWPDVSASHVRSSGQALASVGFRCRHTRSTVCGRVGGSLG